MPSCNDAASPGGNAELGEVRTIEGSGVEVDHRMAERQDFCGNGMGEARSLGAFFGAGEEAVEIAPVRKVAGAGGESGEVYDGECEQGAAQASHGGGGKQAADDFRAVDFIAMHAGGHKQAGAGLSAVEDVRINRERVVAHRGAGGEGNEAARAGGDGYAIDEKGCGGGGRDWHGRSQSCREEGGGRGGMRGRYFPSS